MEVFRRVPPSPSRQPCALAIGNFDGVHLGHQAMLRQLRASAQAQGLNTCVLTFEPHPREYFAAINPAMQAPARIYGERDKIDAMAECGIDQVCIAHFNETLASQSPEAFVEQTLIDELQTRHLLIGDDFRFGARRAGDFALLQRYADRGAFSLARMDSVRVQLDTPLAASALGEPVAAAAALHQQTQESGLRVSSSLVREALAAADFQRARVLLGRPYRLSGHVIHGRKLGRTLGFPTLNLKVPGDRPAVKGIFVVRVDGLAEQPLAGVASLGTRPAVESDGRPLLEVHVLDYAGDAYGKLVRVEFLAKLRDEAHYASLDLLTAQIRRDAQDAREHFARTVSRI